MNGGRLIMLKETNKKKHSGKLSNVIVLLRNNARLHVLKNFDPLKYFVGGSCNILRAVPISPM